MARKHFEFGPFRLDPVDHLLTRGQEPVQLPPKAFETLVLLIENSGHVLYKSALMEALWPDSFVEESNLTQNVFLVRKALGEDDSQQYVKTIPRVGYCFIAPVSEVLDEVVVESHSRERIVIKEEVVECEEETSPSVDAATSARASTVVGRHSRFSVLARVGAGGLMVAIAVGAWFISKTKNPKVDAAAGAPLKSIAVLRFEPISDQDESLGFYLGGEIMAKLSHQKGLTVRPWIETRSFVPKYDPLTAGRELGVDMVVDGQLQKVGDRVTLTARLSNVRSRSVIWTATLDEKFDDIAAVEDIITLRITRALSPALTKGGGVALPDKYTSSAEAYQAYLNGLYFWDKRTTDGFERSVPYFEQAIAKDPNFAPAYASLAEVGAVVGKIPQPDGEALARKSMDLDPTLGEPHAALGFLKFFFQCKWDEGEREFKQATELSPDYATGHQWHSISLAVRGRLGEAESEMKEAEQLDPLSAPIATDMGYTYYFEHQFDLAIEEYKKSLALDPGFFNANAGLAHAYRHKGLYKEAVEQHLRGLEPPEAIKSLRKAFDQSGWEGFLREDLKRQQIRLSAYGAAAVYAQLGDKEQALNWLKKAYEAREFMMYLVKIDPDFDVLHSDPRFEQIIRGMGL